MTVSPSRPSHGGSPVSRLATVLAPLCVVGALGCASTTVTQNPGPHDNGVRYYRPKPYLMLTPADVVKEGTVVGSGAQTVKMSITYLPDYNEEYSIHVK